MPFPVLHNVCTAFLCLTAKWDSICCLYDIIPFAFSLTPLRFLSKVILIQKECGSLSYR